MDFKGTRGKWKHKKGKRAKFEYDNFIIDEYGNHIVKWSNTGNGSHKLTIKESHANGLLISKAPEVIAKLKESTDILKSVLFLFENEMAFSTRFGVKTQIEENENLIKEATEL